MEININIIPDYKKEEISEANRLKTVVRLGIAMLFIFLLFLAYLFSLNKILDINLRSVTLNQAAEGNMGQYDKIKKFDEEFVGINSSSDQIMNLKNDQLYWSNLFSLLNDKLPEGVAITELVNKDYAISLSGKADNRDSLIAFKDGLSKEDCFADINLPLSDLVEKDNIVFQMDLQIKEECLKKK